MRRKRKTAPQNLQVDRKVVSPDNVVSFALKRTRLGVQVERRQQVLEEAHRGHTSFITAFSDESELKRFCEEDELRFAYPLVYQQLIRDFNDLIALDLN